MAAITWYDGQWLDGDTPIVSGESVGLWLGQSVFDGARYFDGVAPDLDLHCARAVASARALGYDPSKTPEEIFRLVWEGIARFPADTALYIRPMFWANGGFVAPDPDTTDFALTLSPMPMPGNRGFAACLSDLRRPAPDMAPTDAKAACLYPNSGRALADARRKGFDNAVMRDALGNVAEFTTANLLMVKDGTVATPAANGAFLFGITLKRVIGLLEGAGYAVRQRRITPRDLAEADEIFSTGNYGKVMPVTRYETREMQPGPVFSRAHELYFDWARSTPTG